MGQKALRRKKFFREHPYCCFCGGSTPAVEEDHVPPRTIFLGRHWPEGYAFPACEECNRATRHDEQVIGMLARVNIASEDVSPETQKETERCIIAVKKYYPDVFEEFHTSVRMKRNAATKYPELKNGYQSYGEIPLMATGEKIDKIVTQFSRKLISALYYFHTKKIIPPQGGVAIKWFTNADYLSEGQGLDTLRDALPGFPNLERSSRSLNNQFVYKYGFSEDYRWGAFLAFFHLSFLVGGIAAMDRDDMHLSPEEAIFPPFNWNPENVGHDDAI